MALMEYDVEIGEMDILEIGYCTVVDSLAEVLRKTAGGYYCLTDGMYARGNVLEGTVLSDMTRGSIEPGKRYEFIQERLGEEDCIGFVPLTKDVVPDLERAGLKKIRGRRNPFTNLRTDLYVR